MIAYTLWHISVSLTDTKPSTPPPMPIAPRGKGATSHGHTQSLRKQSLRSEGAMQHQKTNLSSTPAEELPGSSRSIGGFRNRRRSSGGCSEAGSVVNGLERARAPKWASTGPSLVSGEGGGGEGETGQQQLKSQWKGAAALPRHGSRTLTASLAHAATAHHLSSGGEADQGSVSARRSSVERRASMAAAGSESGVVPGAGLRADGLLPDVAEEGG